MFLLIKERKMFEKITPEQAGISSKIITNFIDMLEDRGASTHGILFMKDGKIFAEGYWSPFHKDRTLNFVKK